MHLIDFWNSKLLKKSCFIEQGCSIFSWYRTASTLNIQKGVALVVFWFTKKRKELSFLSFEQSYSYSDFVLFLVVLLSYLKECPQQAILYCNLENIRAK